MIEDKKFHLNNSFHSFFPFTNEILISTTKNTINVSLYCSSNLVINLSGRGLRPIHQIRPIVGNFHYNVDLLTPYTDLDITIHKTIFKRVWYRMIFKKYNPLTYKIRIKNELLSLL